MHLVCWMTNLILSWFAILKIMKEWKIKRNLSIWKPKKERMIEKQQKAYSKLMKRINLKKDIWGPITLLNLGN